MSSSTVVHSNAFNFQSYVQHGVDPRTGQYAVALSVPELKCNALGGPVPPLALSFSPMNTADVGFGLGWGINLTEYNPQTSILSLGTGETFKVTRSGDPLGFAEKKLDSFHFHHDGGDRYRVVHRSGLVEVLQVSNGLGLPVEMRGADGRRLRLSYVSFNGGQRLETVSDDSGELLRVERSGNQRVELLFFPGHGDGGGPLARYVLQLDADRRVTQVVLPTQEQACWRMEYEVVRGLGCLSQVWTPTGAHETITYGDGGHAFPGDRHDPLPRVTRHVVDPGFEQPEMEVRYAYSDENFLGNGADISWSDDGLDNLYKQSRHDFTYHSTATLWADDTAQRTVKRTFNRFHLLMEEQTTQGNCRKTVTTTHYADNPDNRLKSFDEQPPQCQLPWRVETRWSLTDDGTVDRVEAVDTRYDDHGNLTEQVNADGTREVSDYYPKEGDGDRCPPDPEGFVRSLRSRTVYPAASEHGAAPTLRTEYRYSSLEPVEWSHRQPFLVEVRETLSEEGKGELLRIDTEYYDDPGDELRLGREKTVTQTLNALATVTDYQYNTADSASVGEHVLETTETVTGYDGAHTTLRREHSLLNGLPLLEKDANGVEIRTTYDALNRVTAETVAPGTPYEATRTYQYNLTGGSGDEQAWQQLADVKGVNTRTRFDGAARAIYEERQDVDAAEAEGKAPADAGYRQTFSARYDGLGQLEQETEFDWIGKSALELNTGFAYDDWGQRLRTVRPDGVSEVEELDPIGAAPAPGPIRRAWLEDKDGVALGVTETWLDLFGEPVRIVRIDTKGRTISVQQQFQDGLGRLAGQIDARNAQTDFVYDTFDRIAATTLPDKAVVSRRYAAHSSEDLPVHIDVDGAELGTRLYDGVDRMTEATTGGRKRSLKYDDGVFQPRQVVTPAGASIEYTYRLELGEEVIARQLPDTEATYGYDVKNGRLTGCTEQDAEVARTYFSNGQVRQETRSVAGSSHVVNYDYSLRGRLCGCTALGQTQHLNYDSMGRLESTSAGTTTSTFQYDRYGRVEVVDSVDSQGGHSLKVKIGYDDFNREVSRRFETDDGVRILGLDYDGADALVTQTLSEGGALVRGETYAYDSRGRLETHDCEGSELPLDAYGRAFTRQKFTYDALDNLSEVLTRGEDGDDTALYHYDNADPVQLSRITHSHAAYPAQIDLDYDADGNLLGDERGNELVYDAVGRLITVNTAAGATACSYRYDALDTLAGSEAAGVSEMRLYADDALAARVTGAGHSRYLRGAGVLLAEQMVGSGDSGTVLLAPDRKNSVLGEVRPGAEQHVAYTAYGFPSRGPLWTQLGYNGELHESFNGSQLLGNGYRAFSPEQKRFNSPDDLSPFDEGGFNAYAYCGNEPVNQRDPSGHFVVGLISAVMGVGGLGLTVVGITEKDPAKKMGLILGGLGLMLAGAGGISLSRYSNRGRTNSWWNVSNRGSKGRSGKVSKGGPKEVGDVPTQKRGDPDNPADLTLVKDRFTKGGNNARKNPVASPGNGSSQVDTNWMLNRKQTPPKSGPGAKNRGSDKSWIYELRRSSSTESRVSEKTASSAEFRPLDS